VALRREDQHRTDIHRPTRPRYPDGMSAAEPITPERRRFAIQMPRPLWIGVAAGGLPVAPTK
jgi:hypothetical protein